MKKELNDVFSDNSLRVLVFKKGKRDHRIVDTKQINPKQVTSLVTHVIMNQTEASKKKYTDYSLTIDWSHLNTIIETPSGYGDPIQKTVSSGINKNLRCITNFPYQGWESFKKSKNNLRTTIARMRLKGADDNTIDKFKEDQLEFLKETQERFESIVKELGADTFYTAPIKHKGGKKLLYKSYALLVPIENGVFISTVLGSIAFSTELTVSDDRIKGNKYGTKTIDQQSIETATSIREYETNLTATLKKKVECNGETISVHEVYSELEKKDNKPLSTNNQFVANIASDLTQYAANTSNVTLSVIEQYKQSSLETTGDDIIFGD